MKRIGTVCILMAVAALTATAQTLKVSLGRVVYNFTAEQAGTMTYAEGGTMLTIGGKTFSIADIECMDVSADEVTNNQVGVSYDGTEATVSVAGNVAPYVSAEVKGAHVNITQTNTDAVDGEEITYVLSGTSADGEFCMNGAYKATIQMDGLALTNATPVYSGAAVCILNGKRINLKLTEGTTNTLTDCANPTADLTQKACLYVKGHVEFKQKGTLNIYGRFAHAIKSGDYMTLKNATLNIVQAAKDGISCNEYFLVESGALSISGVGDDGLQCDLDGAASTGETSGHDDEDSGNVYLLGGTLDISVTADAAKAIKAQGDITVSGGTISCTTSGNGTWDTDDQKTKAAACLSSDGNTTVSGGSISLSSSGNGGKGISADGTFTCNGGTLSVTTSGGRVVYANGRLYNGYSGDDRTLDRLGSNYKSSPKGIKADGNINISGGTISISTSGQGAEGMESKAVLTISDGEVACTAYDDCINSASHLYVKGGYVYAHSTNNDGIDANGNCYIQGGTIFAASAGGAEVAIDANTESQYKLYVTGGTIFAIGDLEKGASISGGTCRSASNWSGNTWYALYNGGTLVGAFMTPASTSTAPNHAPGWGGGGGGFGPGGEKQKLVVYTSSTPSLKSGVSVSGGTSVWNGCGNMGGSVSGGSTVELSNY